jgi:hypothetical protein
VPLPVILYIARFHLQIQGFSGNCREFVRFPLPFLVLREGKLEGKPSRLGPNLYRTQELGLLGQMVRIKKNSALRPAHRAADCRIFRGTAAPYIALRHQTDFSELWYRVFSPRDR